jgi:hypothetical protein
MAKDTRYIAEHCAVMQFSFTEAGPLHGICAPDVHSA